MLDWIKVGPDEEDYPTNDIEVILKLKNCTSGMIKHCVAVHVEADDHDFEVDGVEISYNWDIIAWAYFQDESE